MKILVVEDEQILAKVFQEKFEKARYEVKIASDGQSGVDLAKSFKPDIIILDLVLPKKNGFEVLEELKADDNFKSTPVIVISNLGEDEDIKRALSLGAVDYFAKAKHPINEIVDKVKAAFKKSK
jgi:two-component system alkaline phosphatase synthesis response regulator PhoP